MDILKNNSLNFLSIKELVLSLTFVSNCVIQVLKKKYIKSNCLQEKTKILLPALSAQNVFAQEKK